MNKKLLHLEMFQCLFRCFYQIHKLFALKILLKTNSYINSKVQPEIKTFIYIIFNCPNVIRICIGVTEI